MSWNDPGQPAVRKALRDWRGSTGLRMTNITVEYQGDRYAVTTDFTMNGEKVGVFRACYRQDGWVHLQHVKLEDEVTATGLMSELLADFLPYYREWGLTRVWMDAETQGGVAFAESQGMTPNPDEPTRYEMDVP